MQKKKLEPLPVEYWYKSKIEKGLLVKQFKKTVRIQTPLGEYRLVKKGYLIE